MPIEIESPEELGYDTIANNLSESSFSDMRLADHGIDGDVSGCLLPTALRLRCAPVIRCI